MNKSLLSCFRRSANFHWGLWVLAAAVGPAAVAQPTGNPKGTLSPDAKGNASKAPVARNRDTPADAEHGQEGPRGSRPEAVSGGRLRTPGVGTAGGLTGRHPGDGSTHGTTETDQAPPVKKQH